tara:strand:+ start:120197 stop:121129 length:933 start_codon:yes stop_codon:yes gene_type:complete
VLPRQLLGPLAIALALAFQLVAAPVASAQRAPRAKATKTSKAAKAAKIRTQRTAPRRLAAKRSASTSLRLRGAAKSTTRSSLARPKAVAGTKARPIQAQTRARAAKPASKNVPPKDGRWHKPLKALKGGIAKLKANPQVVRLIKFSSRVSAKMTRTLDGWQARAPPLVARTMSALRTYSLPSIAAYTLSRVKNDKAFLGSYLVAKSVVSNLVLPGAIAIGMDPVLATILSALTAPVTVGVVVLRERHIRNAAGESISVKDTAKLIGREYRDFAKARKAAKSAKAHAGVTSSPVATTSAATTSAAALAASR